MKYSLIQKVNPEYTVVEQVCINRGVALDKVPEFLNTTDKHVHSPMLLDNMMSGVGRLIKHIAEQNKVLLIVDSDADGYTSSAAFVNYLNTVFPTFVRNSLDIHLHNGKEHGICPEEHQEGELESYGLIIVPDAGSNQYEIHKELSDKGVDILVLDHHEAEKYSEHAIVINNQLSENYPNKSLSGAGVVYQFCRAMDAAINKQGVADTILDIVAVGLVADLMDLRSLETKRLVEKGLKNMNNTFLCGLVEKQSFSLGSEITPTGIAWYIAPLINATIRVGSQEEKMVLFKSMLDHEAMVKVDSTKRGCKGQKEFLCQQAIRNCVNIRNRQQTIRDKGYAFIEEIIEEKDLNKNQILVVPLENDAPVDTRITGLVANQLMSKYGKPVLLLRHTKDEENGSYRGSGRGHDKSELKDFKKYLTDSNLFEYAEGHKSAFGASIKNTLLDEFIETSNADLQGVSFDPQYDLDFIFTPQDSAKEVYQSVFTLGRMKRFWGKGFEEALIGFQNIPLSIVNVELKSPDKRPTLKINLFSDTGTPVSLIKFHSSLEEYEKLASKTGRVLVDIVGTASINYWNNEESPQVFVKDYKIIEEERYVF